MAEQVDRAGLRVNRAFARVLEAEFLPGSGISIDRFWEGLADLKPSAPAPAVALPQGVLWVEELSAARVIEALSARYLPLPAPKIKETLERFFPLKRVSWHAAEDLHLHRKELAVGIQGGLVRPEALLGTRAAGSSFYYLLAHEGQRFEIISDFLTPAADALGADHLRLEAIADVAFQASAVALPRLEELRLILALRRGELALARSGPRLPPADLFVPRRGRAFGVLRQALPIWQVSGAFEGMVEGVEAEVLDLLLLGLIARQGAEALRFTGAGRGAGEICALLSLPKGRLQRIEVEQIWATPAAALSAILQGLLCTDAPLKTEP